ncbi:hypothetical protein AB4238_16315 [Shewanella sp. 10N.286.45.A1]|uniref:hypothetical protein n=1 Tax=Shewanella sp. 10N.286.45.A1 TaxID=3229694 RepID=UPI0035542200
MDRLNKMWEMEKTREIINLICFITLTLISVHCFFYIGSIITEYNNSILTLAFINKVWMKLLLFILSSGLLFFFTRSKWYKNHSINKYTGSQVAAQLLTVAAILAGAYVSISSNDINTAINCHISKTSCLPTCMDLSIIGNTIILIVIFYVIHGSHSTQLKSNREEHENAQSENLRLAIQIAPPPYFAKKLADSSDIIEDMSLDMGKIYASLLDESLPQKNDIEAESILEEQRKILRCALMALGRLAQAYDNVDPAEKNSVQYRVNLMLCLKSDNEDVSSYFEKTHPKNTMRFALPFEAKPYFHLYIDNRYSVNVEQTKDELNQAKLFKLDQYQDIKPQDFELDDTVTNAIMPVYWEENKDVANYNVIGAPKSIVQRKAQFISDTVREAEKADYYSHDIQSSVIEYFKTDKKGRSIVSLPVATRHYELSAGHEENIDHFLGAINIYRNTKDIFAGAKKNFEFFADFTRPLRLVIARMAYTHMDTIAIIQQQKLDSNYGAEE